MTLSLLTSHPVGERGTVANRKGTVIGATEIMSEGLGDIEPTPFTLLVIRLDGGQGGYLSGPGSGGSQRILPQANSPFSTYVSCILVAPDCWTPEGAKDDLAEARAALWAQYPDGVGEPS